MTTELDLRRFSVDDVHQMVAAGIIAEDEPVELLDGRLIVVSPQNPEHSLVVTLLAEMLREAYRGAAVVREEKPLVAAADSMPEPDLAVVHGAATDYAAAHPQGRDALLVVEVSLTSQSIDRQKAAIYARAEVPEYWLIDLGQRRLEAHTEPQPDGRYRVVRILGVTDTLGPPGRDLSWQVRDLLPPD